MFFTYSQNNSGGSFYGPTYVIIEADSAAAANEFAENYTDIYFDGCSDGRDCSCCGDRWYAAWNDDEGEDAPMIYQHDLTDLIADRDKFLKENPTFLADSLFGIDFDIYYKDGTKKEFRFSEKEIEAATKLVKAAQPKLWGFYFYPNWEEPTEVFKGSCSDPGNRFYDDEGNMGVEVAWDGENPIPGWHLDAESLDIMGSEEYAALHFSAKTKKEAEKARADFLALIQPALDAKKQALADIISVFMQHDTNGELKKFIDNK